MESVLLAEGVEKGLIVQILQLLLIVLQNVPFVRHYARRTRNRAHLVDFIPILDREAMRWRYCDRGYCN